MPDAATVSDEIRARQDAPPTPAQPSSFQEFSERVVAPDRQVDVARQNVETARASEKAGLEERARVMAPTIQGLRQQIGEVGAMRGEAVAGLQPPTIPPPPKRQLTDFLAPVNGERPETSIAKFIQAVGLLATGISGAAKGDARASLSALTGAMHGWAEGDRERADREFATWKTKTDAMLTQHALDRQRVMDWIENANLSLSQQMLGAQLQAQELGLKDAAKRFETEGMEGLLGFAVSSRAHEDAVAQKAATLLESHRAHVAQEENRKLELERRVEADKARIEDQAENRRSREDIARMHRDSQLFMKELFLGSQVTGMMYYDHQLGDLRQATRLEVAEDVKAQRAGEPARLTALPAQTFQSLKRLTIAPPLLDRLDKLIDRVTVEAKGENLTSALIAKLQKRAGISEDLQEFASLSADALLELGTALSGRSSPLITVVRLLKGEAMPEVVMTTPVAKTASRTMRTTINNRIIDFTQDPEAPKKLTRGLLQYQDSPTQAAEQAQKAGAPPSGATGGARKWRYNSATGSLEPEQ